MPSSVLPQSSLFRRIFAGLGAALVLLLTVAAASPTVHAWLHAPVEAETQGCGHGHDHGLPQGKEEAGCAVVLFCHGALPVLGWQQLFVAEPVMTEVPVRRTDSVLAARPRYRHVPSHAPPVV